MHYFLDQREHLIVSKEKADSCPIWARASHGAASTGRAPLVVRAPPEWWGSEFAARVRRRPCCLASACLWRARLALRPVRICARRQQSFFRSRLRIMIWRRCSRGMKAQLNYPARRQLGNHGLTTGLAGSGAGAALNAASRFRSATWLVSLSELRHGPVGHWPVRPSSGV